MVSHQTITNEYLIQSLDSVLGLARSFAYVDHSGVMGVLRESLIENFIEPLLMPPYKVGTGVVVDSQGRQSGQCDVIVWDDSIFRPVYSARGAGIYLIESVVAIIEIKSTLKLGDFKQAISRSREFKEMAILRPPSKKFPNHFWVNEPGILPLNMIFGFRSNAKKEPEIIRAEKVAKREKVELRQYIQLISVPGKTSWVSSVTGPQSHACRKDHRYHEVLMPFSLLMNSLKNISKKRGQPNLGSYMVPYSL